MKTESQTNPAIINNVIQPKVSNIVIPIILIVLVLSGIAYDQWQTMRTLERSIVFSDVMDDIKGNLNQAANLGNSTPTPPSQEDIDTFSQHIDKSIKSLGTLISGGELYNTNINPIHDDHLRQEAIILRDILENLKPQANENNISLKISGPEYTQTHVMIYDMSNDMEQIIEDDRENLTTTFTVTYIIIAALLSLFLIHTRTTRRALSHRNEELEIQVQQRTKELEDVVVQNNDQMLELAQSHVRDTLFKRSLEELRKADEALFNQGNITEFLEKILSSITNALGAQGSGIFVKLKNDKQPQFICHGYDRKDINLNPEVLFENFSLKLTSDKQCVRIDDLSKDEDLIFLKEALPQISSFIGIPLSLNNQNTGAIYMSRSGELLPFSSSDETLLMMFQPHIQHALERNHLLNKVRKTNEALANDIAARKKVEIALKKEKEEQQDLIKQLQGAQEQLLQSEKMASIGQLAAGVAHEINNPVGYINSNLGSLVQYINNLLDIIQAYEQCEHQLPEDNQNRKIISQLKSDIDLDFLKEDIISLLDESQEGVTRVKQIVQDLKDFSHVDESEWQWADLHKGLDSTLNIAHNEIKYKATVKKEYGEIPPVECVASQVNQVFMNMLVNAAHAIETNGDITIRTGIEDNEVWIEISDTGKGIEKENLNRIFDPFFTTKPVGKGTGLGLSLSYSIIKKHDGRIDAESEVGKGTTFRIWLPIQQTEPKAGADTVA